MVVAVNIADAKARLSELIAASIRGEEVVVQRSGIPQVRLVPIIEVRNAALEARAAKRKSFFGAYKHEFEGVDTSMRAFQNLHLEPDQEYEREFGSST